jgi:hypothetical protein
MASLLPQVAVSFRPMLTFRQHIPAVMLALIAKNWHSPLEVVDADHQENNLRTKRLIEPVQTPALVSLASWAP